MGHRNAKGAHGSIEDGEVNHRFHHHQKHQTNHGADEVKGDMNHGNALTIAVDTQAGKHRRDTGTDVLSHDDGQTHTVGNVACHG